MGTLLTVVCQAHNRLRILWISGFIIGLQSIAAAQTTVGLGAEEDSVAFEQLPIMPVFGGGQKGEGAPSASMNLRPYCPVPMDQGGTSACGGFAAGYGAMTIIGAVQANTTQPEKIRRLACSPWYIYNQIKLKAGDCSGASSMEAAIELLKTQGVCLQSEFRPTEGDCDAMPGATARQSAATRRIKDAAALFPRRTEPEQIISAVRSALAGGLPVIANIKVFESFRNIPPGSKYWRARKTQTDTYGGKHFLVVTGYDDRTQAFEVMSSWGTGWADGGFVHLSYGDFAQICLMAYQILPYGYEQQTDPVVAVAPPSTTAANPPRHSTAGAGSAAASGTRTTSNLAVNPDVPVFLQGTFEFLQPIWNETTGAYELITEPVTYDASSGIYSTQKAVYGLETRFMLRSSAIPAGKYVYVFSCDPVGKVQLHWPKDERQAQYVPGSHAVITIPSATTALSLKHSGDDFLCILYSDDPITDLRERIARLRGYTEANFHSRLQGVFPGLLIDRDKIICASGAMKATSRNVRKDGTVMAVVLRVRGE